ncbi:MAG: response regulator transcription factor [Candidatus Hydrothermarchaeales archaeon]
MAKILIVDDDRDIRFIVSMILKRKGYVNVIEASSGMECLQRIRETKPDLVILDIMMPDMSGWEVCKKIKETNPHLPVSMLSVKSDEGDIRRSLEAGAERYLSKPINRDDILRTVQDLGVIQTNN